jgi:phosphoenolpyruvate synthase/pyruvate phosphate dikinase
MSNKIRHYMKEQVSALLPLLHETYMRIGRFQKNRSTRNETLLVECLDEVGVTLQQFKDIMQVPKRPYFDAILRKDLSASDRIIALDTAVGAMHIEFSAPRMYAHQETEKLRLALEQCRSITEPFRLDNHADADKNVLCRGLPASPGVAWGQVFIWNENIPYTEIPDRCILVSIMTRPEIATFINRVDGIVTDMGGRLCHAAIIALEKGVPCVVGTGNATEILSEGMTVCVNGDTGCVYKDH